MFQVNHRACKTGRSKNRNASLQHKPETPTESSPMSGHRKNPKKFEWLLPVRLVMPLYRHRCELRPSGGIEKSSHIERHGLCADVGAATETRPRIAELPHRGNNCKYFHFILHSSFGKTVRTLQHPDAEHFHPLLQVSKSARQTSATCRSQSANDPPAS